MPHSTHRPRLRAARVTFSDLRLGGRLPGLALVLALAGLGGLPAAAGAQAGSANAPAPKLLSNQRTVTFWAHPTLSAAVHSSPTSASPTVGRLHLGTEDAFPEVYVMLRWASDAEGRSWIQVPLPMRPHGRIGWVRRESLGVTHRVDTQLRVDRTRLRATLYRAGRPVWSAPVGVGKSSTPTPAGRFYVRERFSNLPGGNGYGPLAFGTGGVPGSGETARA